MIPKVFVIWNEAAARPGYIQLSVAVLSLVFGYNNFNSDLKIIHNLTEYYPLIKGLDATGIYSSDHRLEGSHNHLQIIKSAP